MPLTYAVLPLELVSNIRAASAVTRIVIVFVSVVAIISILDYNTKRFEIVLCDTTTSAYQARLEPPSRCSTSVTVPLATLCEPITT